jgi:DNA (cytosine-5)-methyltransferase 1
MGGMSLAARELGMEVAFGVDVSSAAIRTFSKNFPNARAIEGSVRSSKVIARCEEVFDKAKDEGHQTLVVSGPPCQGFSVAGSRDPSDPRNQILPAVARAIVTLSPDCALIENVSGVLSEKHAPRLETFESVFTEAEYNIISIELDACDFGVAQKRKRAFFLVSRDELDRVEVLESLNELKQPTISVEQAFRDLPSARVRPDDYSDEHDNGDIPNHFAMRHSQRVIEKIAALDPGTGPMSYRKLHPKRPSNTLFSGHRAPPAHFSEPRSITTREAARLQGFPDDFRVYGSFGNQMGLVTNAVPPPLARTVLQVLAEFTGLLALSTHAN